MLIMALRSPVASEHLRSIDNDDAVLAQVVGAATGFSLTSSFLGPFRGLPQQGRAWLHQKWPRSAPCP
jgi:hypothetical protein